MVVHFLGHSGTLDPAFVRNTGLQPVGLPFIGKVHAEYQQFPAQPQFILAHADLQLPAADIAEQDLAHTLLGARQGDLLFDTVCILFRGMELQQIDPAFFLIHLDRRLHVDDRGLILQLLPADLHFHHGADAQLPGMYQGGGKFHPDILDEILRHLPAVHVDHLLKGKFPFQRRRPRLC